MAKPDYTRVHKMVDRVLRENNIFEPPISPREIAAAYGIDVIEVTFAAAAKDVAGFFDFEDEEIYINGEDPYNRKTFTIAHELGHYFLHRDHFLKNKDDYMVLMRRPFGAADDPKEKEANAFAAHLLVPRKVLDRYWKYASVEELAELFVVSKDVIRARLQFEYGINA